VAPRIAWAVELLGLEADDRVLEVGCGSGAAVALVCRQLEALGGSGPGGVGSVVGIDRSATAIGRAVARNAEAIQAGRARFEQVDLAGFDPVGRSFDLAFAVNINVFWTGSADAECEVLARALRPGGVVHLVYDGPGLEGARDVGPAVVGNLARHGFRADVRRGVGGLLGVSGRLG
jgi:SAM-dependent methyltransferase